MALLSNKCVGNMPISSLILAKIVVEFEIVLIYAVTDDWGAGYKSLMPLVSIKTCNFLYEFKKKMKRKKLLSLDRFLLIVSFYNLV